MSIGQILWRIAGKDRLKDKGPCEPLTTPRSLVLIVTTRCNFSCKHCLRDLEGGQDMPWPVAQTVLAQASRFSYRHVCLTGGEPLVYPDLKRLIASIVDQGYRFSLITNGYEFPRWAEFLRSHQKAISFIGFSLESTDSRQHDHIRRKGSFENLLADFDLCRRHRIPFRIIHAASALNADRVFDAALFAKKKGAQALVMTTVLPCPRSEKNDLVLTAAQRRELLDFLRRLPRLLNFPVLIGADILASGGLHLCEALNSRELTINPRGELVQCCELANFGHIGIGERATVTSVTDKPLAEALKILLEHNKKFAERRIDACEDPQTAGSIDFNSCFYCIQQLGGEK